MSVEVIELKNPLLVPSERLSKVTDQIIEGNYYAPVSRSILPPGEHDITPASALDRIYIYNIIVFPDGGARIHYRKRDQTHEECVRIPEDGLVVTMQEQTADRSRVRLHEIVSFIR